MSLLGHLRSLSGHQLDTFIAPDLSRLKTCSAPEIPNPPNYPNSLHLNNMFRARYKEAALISIANAIRRTSFAITNYGAGRQYLLTYVESLPDQKISAYFQALSYFETCILHTYTAMLLFKEFFRGDEQLENYFRESTEEMLDFNNAIKHFDEDINNFKNDKNAKPLLNPIWITEDSIECLTRKHKPECGNLPAREKGSKCSLSFYDLAEKLKNLAEISKILSTKAPENTLAEQNGLN